MLKERFLITILAAKFFLSSGSLLAFPDAHCSDCDFYPKCLEKRMQCGPTGYALAYGDKYCNRLSFESRLSDQGKLWRDTTRTCLQKSLASFTDPSLPDRTCEEVAEAAFNSHSKCYTEEKISVCHLPISDLRIILKNIDKSDLFSARGSSQVKSVASHCILDLGERMKKLNLGTREGLVAEPSETQSKMDFWLQTFELSN